MQTTNNVQIFLSYARQDRTKVEKLYADLVQVGFKPWMDTKDVLPGQDWKKMLFKNIRESPFFVACVSNNSINKRGVLQEEIREALEVVRTKLENDNYLVPIRLEDCTVPSALETFQWVNLYEADGFDLLVNGFIIGFQRLGIEFPLTLRPKPNSPSDKRDHSLAKSSLEGYFNATEKIRRSVLKENISIEEIFAVFLKTLIDEFKIDYAVISLVDKTAQTIRTVAGSNEGMNDVILLSVHPLDSVDIQPWVVKVNKSAIISDYDSRLDQSIFQRFNHEAFVRAFIPITGRNAVLGLVELGVAKREERGIDQDQLQVFEQLAGILGITLENHEIFSKLEEFNRNSINILNKIT